MAIRYLKFSHQSDPEAKTKNPMGLKSFKEIVGPQYLDELNPKVRELSRVSDGLSVTRLCLDYSVIFLAAFISLRAQNWAVYLFAVIIIAGRQHGLLCLLHEAVHGLLFKRRAVNNFAAEVFCILPLGNCFRAFSWAHLKHHQFLNSEYDPEWYKKTQQGWNFPISKWQFLKLTFFECVLRNTRGRFLKFFHMFSNPNYPLKYKLGMGSYYLIGFLLLNHWNLLEAFALYWLVPYFFILPYISYTRSLAEHFGLAYTSELTSSRNVKPNFLNRLFIPHNTTFHLSHHLFPSVPSYNLSKLTEILQKNEGFKQNAASNNGYLLSTYSVLGDILNLRKRSSTKVDIVSN